jgi:hypothetical protein
MTTVEPQIYGVDIALAPTGDLVVNAAGGLTALGGVEVMAQALQLRLRTALGDLALHPTYGSNLPVGGKMNPEAVAASVNGELVRMVSADPRISSAVVSSVNAPPSENPNAVQIGVKCVLAGGESFSVSGLPAEARVSEVSFSGSLESESGLSSFEEQPFFADEEQAREIQSESELESIINDLPGE